MDASVVEDYECLRHPFVLPERAALMGETGDVDELYKECVGLFEAEIKLLSYCSAYGHANFHRAQLIVFDWDHFAVCCFDLEHFLDFFDVVVGFI